MNSKRTRKSSLKKDRKKYKAPLEDMRQAVGEIYSDDPNHIEEAPTIANYSGF